MKKQETYKQDNYTLFCFDKETKEPVDLVFDKTDNSFIPHRRHSKTKVSSCAFVSSCANVKVHVEDNGSVQDDYPFIQNDDGSRTPKSSRQAILNGIDSRFINGSSGIDFYIMFDCDIGAPSVTAWKLPRG